MCGKCSLQLCRQKQALSCACCKLEVPSGTHTHTHTHTHKTNDAQPTLYVCSLRSNTWPRASKRGWNGQFQGRSSSASASEIKMPPLRAQVHKRTRQTPPPHTRTGGAVDNAGVPCHARALKQTKSVRCEYRYTNRQSRPHAHIPEGQKHGVRWALDIQRRCCVIVDDFVHKCVLQ